MLHKLSFALLFAVLTYGQIASAQVPLQGACPAPGHPKEFDWDNFTGIWYENARFGDSFEYGTDCVIISYAVNNETIYCGLSGFSFLNNRKSYFVSTGKVIAPGVFSVIFQKNGEERINKILDTDFHSWAVIFNCIQLLPRVHIERAQILTRERNPSAETINNAVKAMVKNNISPSYLGNTRQWNCTNRL